MPCAAKHKCQKQILVNKLAFANQILESWGKLTRIQALAGGGVIYSVAISGLLSNFEEFSPDVLYVIQERIALIKDIQNN